MTNGLLPSPKGLRISEALEKVLGNLTGVIMLSMRLSIVVFGFILLVCHLTWAGEPQTLEPLLSRNSRLMVFSPHPDDETLGAGGLIQRVLSLGGRAKVVFMTSGDGYPEGVEVEDHISHPSAKDYRKYGEEREKEARNALATLGMKRRDVVFLGFPDGGLCYLLWKFRSDPKAFTSPFTLQNHPPASEMIVPHTDYNGHDLRTEIENLLARFHPDLVAVTPPEDEHPDHCSTYYFVRKAMADLEAKESSFRSRLLTFLIHYRQWPFDQGMGMGLHLSPPENLPDKKAQWASLPLGSKETETKRKAILAYHTQMLVIGPFLLSFSRANEVFLVEHQALAKEMESLPCCWK
jgi:LmbE family N-acetylglucosaminyl deacetylase